MMKKINWKNYQTDKDTYHSYVPLYETIFQSIHFSDVLMEIGVSIGGSLRAFRDMLGCKVVGLDVVNKIGKENLDNIEFIVMDAYAEKDVQALARFDGKCAAVIDDGSHVPEHQYFVAANYGRFLRPGGLLVVEDICSYAVAKRIIEELPSDLKYGACIVDLRQCKCKN